MHAHIDNTLKIAAITANLAALHAILEISAARSAQAHELVVRGEQNGAIGTLLDLDQQLSDAQALYAAALALHRSK